MFVPNIQGTLPGYFMSQNIWNFTNYSMQNAIECLLIKSQYIFLIKTKYPNRNFHITCKYNLELRRGNLLIAERGEKIECNER